MPLTNQGRDEFAGALVGVATVVFNKANSYIGVGNSSGTFAASQTDLQGASKTRKAMDATYPTRLGNVLTFRSTFSTSDANYEWLEWGVFNGTSSTGSMLNRIVPANSLGVKNSSQSWQITCTLTVNNP
jgi:hypothetical protein